MRRLRVEWPDPRPFAGRAGRPVRILAVSDERDPTLEIQANRDAVAPIDLVVGCGDVEPDWLALLADAFRAPLVFVRGNHDRGMGWRAAADLVPEPLAAGRTVQLAGIEIAGFEWPGVDGSGNERHDDLAWRHVLCAFARDLGRRVLRRRRPLLAISHVAPRGVGDGPDAYHHGIRAYRWLLDRLRPPLWLHGHTTLATVEELVVQRGPTTVVNVTGAVLIDLVPPGSAV